MKSYRLAVPLSFALVAAGIGLMHPALAASKATPAPSASPAPSPTPTQEPLDVQIPRLEAAVKANPNDKDSMAQLATDYLQTNRPDLAAQLTQKLLDGGTKNAQIYFTNGAAYAALGKADAGIASMEQAANLEPTNIIILQSLTSMYMRANRPADAERVAKRALTFNNASELAYENYGYVLAAEQKYDDARAQFQAAQKLEPKNAHPIVMEARTYADQKAYQLAFQAFDRAIAADPKNLEGYIGKAQLAASQHDVKTAIATYEQIYALQTDDVDKAAVLAEEAKVYAIEKQDANADATFKKAIDQFPKVLATHLVYGDYLISRNDKAGAQREWTTALGPNRDNPEALARLGNIAAANNDMNGAVSDFKRMTEIAAQDPRGYLLLGQAYMQQKNFTAARDAYRASFNLARTPEALVGLATADQASGNYNEAIQIYEAIDKTAQPLVKQNPGLLYNLGRAYQSAHQNDKAKSTYQRFLTYLKPGTPAYTEVKQTIASLDRGSSSTAAKPKSSPPPHK